LYLYSQNSLLRLVLPDSSCRFRIWDTPCPPAVESCHLYPVNATAPQRLRTIDLNLTTSITFFYKSRRIYRIHGHTPKILSAQLEHQKITERLQNSIVWLYFPLSQQERIQDLGVSRSLGLVVSIFSPYTRLRLTNQIRTTSGRVYYIGEWTSDAGAVDVTISCGLLNLLLYNNSKTCEPISSIGISSSSLAKEILRLEPRSCPISQDIYYSSARLDHIKNICIFYDQVIYYYKGILFIYYNGNQQAVGQYALGIFPEETVESPTLFYHRSKNTTQGTIIKVRFATEFIESIDWTS
jgi:Mo-dependent nitrogenase C-terminus